MNKIRIAHSSRKNFKKFWYLFLVLFIEGSALMGVELMGAKLLSPFYGSSLYAWKKKYNRTFKAYPI